MNQFRVLFADDNPLIRMAVEAILRAVGFTQITVACNADDAAAHLARTDYDAVVCDQDFGHGQRRGHELFDLWRDQYAGRWLILTADPRSVPARPGMEIMDKLDASRRVDDWLAALTPPRSTLHAPPSTAVSDAARTGAECLAQLNSPPSTFNPQPSTAR